MREKHGRQTVQGGLCKLCVEFMWQHALVAEQRNIGAILDS